MKNLKSTLKFMTLVLVVSVIFSSCSKDETIDTPDTEQQDTSEIALSAEIDEATSSISDIMNDVYESEENTTGRSAQMTGLPDCVTITVLAEQGFREITIDFGTEGCVVRGNTLKGKIIMSYNRDPEAQEVLITSTLEDFFFNNKNILGGRSILKQLSNDNGNPQSTHTVDHTIIWPNGAEASRQGVKIREWIEGFGSGIWSDNVFEVTGNWTTTFRNGNTHTYEVLTPLRREVICTYFVSGTFDVQRTLFGGVFDYGEGDCDNMAIFTFNNGDVIDITLN